MGLHDVVDYMNSWIIQSMVSSVHDGVQTNRHSFSVYGSSRILLSRYQPAYQKNCIWSSNPFHHSVVMVRYIVDIMNVWLIIFNHEYWTSKYLSHFSSSTRNKVLSRGVEVVNVCVVPVSGIPHGQEPYVPVTCRHLLLVSPAYDGPRCWRVEVRYDDPHWFRLKLVQVLREKERVIKNVPWSNEDVNVSPWTIFILLRDYWL